MDILKQLETKLNVLVQQRNQMKEELARYHAERGSVDEEIQGLRRRLEDMQAECDELKKERVEVRTEIESILKRLEELG